MVLEESRRRVIETGSRGRSKDAWGDDARGRRLCGEKKMAVLDGWGCQRNAFLVGVGASWEIQWPVIAQSSRMHDAGEGALV